MTVKQNLSEATRDYFSMDIDLPGNCTYNVGDLVWCEVPSYNASEMTTDSKVMRSDVINSFLTGRYLISKLHHQFDMIDQKHTTSRNRMLETCLPTIYQTLIHLKHKHTLDHNLLT